MNFVKRPLGVDLSVDLAVGGLDDESQRGRKWPIHYDSVELLAIVADFATILLASVLAGLSYHLQDSAASGEIGKSLGSAVLVSALFISLMKIRGMYRPTELLGLRNQVRTVCLVWTCVFLLLAGTVFALKIGSEISRGTSGLFAVFGLVALVVHRCILRDLLVRGLAGKKFSGRNIVLITDHSQIGDASLTQMLTGLGFSVAEHFIFPPPGANARHRERIVTGVIDYIRGSDIQEIVVGADPNRWPELSALAAELRVLPFPVSFVPLGTASEIFKRPSRDLGNAVCVELQRGPLTPFEHAAKRCVDFLFAGVALAALLPLLAVVAVAIKLELAGSRAVQAEALRLQRQELLHSQVSHDVGTRGRAIDRPGSVRR